MAPVDQLFPVVFPLLRITLSPAQKVVGPLALMAGIDGTGFTVMSLAKLVDLHPFEPVVVTE